MWSVRWVAYVLSVGVAATMSCALCAFWYLRSQLKFAEYGIALGLRRYKPLQHHEELDARARGVCARTLDVAEVDQKLLRAQLNKAYFVFEFAHGP